MKIKLIIADDHSIVREGLKQLLEIDEKIKVVLEVSDGEELLEKIKEYEADILLLDISMPGIDGLEILKIIRKEEIPIKIIMLTLHNGVEYLIKALEESCDGYLLKDSNSGLLLKAIYAVYEGDTFIQPSLLPALNNTLINDESIFTKRDKLTKREKEVLAVLSEGLCNKEISVLLDISERTVKNHLSNIFRKIDVIDRTQAAVFAIKVGLNDDF